MARRGGRVQLEQSHMRLALNMVKMAKGGFSCTAIEETQYLIQKPRAEVREEKQCGVEFPGHTKVKAAIERHPAMLCHNQTAGCLPCQNGTANNPQTHWRRKGPGAPPPNRHRPQTPVPTPEPTPPLPETIPAPTGDPCGAQHLQITNFPPGYAYSHTSLPCSESHTLKSSTQDSEHD